MSRYISVDCGLKGGLTFWSSVGVIESIISMPLTSDGELSMLKLMDMFKTGDTIIIEDQFSPKGKNQAGMKTNLVNFGMIVGIAKALGKDTRIIRASTWTSALGLSNVGRSPLLPKLTKKDRTIKANELYSLNLKPSQDGMADSVLIGHYFFKRERLI